MRRILMFTLLAALAVGAFACGGGDKAPAPEGETESSAARPAAGGQNRIGAPDQPEAVSPAPADAVSPPPAAPKKRFAMIANFESAFWREAAAGGRAAAEAAGAEFELRTLPSGSPAEQIQILETLAAESFDGIALSPLDAAALAPAIDAASAGAIVVTLGADAPESKRAAHAGTNDYEAGRAAGDEIAKAMHEGGAVMMFAGAPAAAPEAERERGILDALQGTGIEVIETRADGGSAAQAEAGAKEALASNPRVNCLVGLGAYHGPALAAAAKAAGRAGRVQIVCFDQDPATLEAIREGTIRAAVAENGYELGSQSIRLLGEISRGGSAVLPENKLIHVAPDAINGDNVESFRARGRKPAP